MGTQTQKRISSEPHESEASPSLVVSLEITDLSHGSVDRVEEESRLARFARPLVERNMHHHRSAGVQNPEDLAEVGQPNSDVVEVLQNVS